MPVFNEHFVNDGWILEFPIVERIVDCVGRFRGQADRAVDLYQSRIISVAKEGAHEISSAVIITLSPKGG